MSSPTTNSECDDSILFRASAIPKRKPASVQADMQTDYDMPLGIALSKSLKKSTKNLNNKTKQFLINVDQCNKNKRNANKKFKSAVLINRTQEDRQRIITEKAAVVLLDDDDDNNGAKVEVFFNKHKKSKLLVIGDLLLKYHNRVCRLWKLSENEGEPDWFVESVKPYITSEKRQKDKDSETIVEFSPKPDELEMESGSRDISTNSKPLSNAVLKLNLPKSTVDEDWRKMINNKNFSDFTASSKDGKIFYLHSLIINVRCPSASMADLKLIFTKFDYLTILVFLEYLYCGTLNNFNSGDLENLLKLASDVGYKELKTVLNCVEVNLKEEEEEGDPEFIPSSLTPDFNIPDVSIIGSSANKKEGSTADQEDIDLFGNEMVDLTQSSHSSCATNYEENETNIDKSYWSFIQCQQRKEEEMRIDEEREKSIIETEREKIETSIRKQNEMIQKILKEYEQEETFIPQQCTKFVGEQRLNSRRSNTENIKEGLSPRNPVENDTCIIISSDSDTQGSKPEDRKLDQPAESDADYDLPYFDPYEDYNHFSNCGFSPVHAHSQSLITREVSEYDEFHLNETIRIGEKVGNDSTDRRSKKISSSKKPEGRKSRTKSFDLSASRIIRKSLGLAIRTSKPTGRKSIKKKKEESNKAGNIRIDHTTSLVDSFSASPKFTSSTPIQKKDYVEFTPSPKAIEMEQSITPYPEYSRMGETLLREHLAKYGLKRNLGKRKAKKILKHIYEELHPYLNEETGKLVKKVCVETPKNHKKGKSRIAQARKERTKMSSKNRTGNAKLQNNKNLTNKEKSNNSCENINNSHESTLVYDSNCSAYDHINETLTQASPSNPQDLPSAMNEYLRLNPDFHKKILLYEPIWVKDLQKNLKETFKKHYKVEDLMNFLDQQCITFRSSPKQKKIKLKE